MEKLVKEPSIGLVNASAMIKSTLNQGNNKTSQLSLHLPKHIFFSKIHGGVHQVH